jgi:hypothetical protein
MKEWLVRNFGWNGFTSRDAYRSWLPLIITTYIAYIISLWVWGDRGQIQFTMTPYSFAILSVHLPLSIGIVLLTARRFRNAGITRIWLLPLFLNVNLPIGDLYVSSAIIWGIGAIFVAATEPDIQALDAVAFSFDKNGKR